MKLSYAKEIPASVWEDWAAAATMPGRWVADWEAAPFSFQGQPLYLLVESHTGLPVVVDELNQGRVVQIIDYWVDQVTSSANLQAHYHTALSQPWAVRATGELTPLMRRYLRVLTNHQGDLMQKLTEFATIDERVRLLYTIPHFLLEQVTTGANVDLFYALTKQFARRPEAADRQFKYVTLPMNFKDPREWAVYEWQPIKQVPKAVIKQVKQNNAAMINQFKQTLPAADQAADGLVANLLTGYLNQGFLTDYFRVVTTSLDEVLTLTSAMPDELLTRGAAIMEKFYTFLMKTGLIRSADAKWVKDQLKQQVKDRFSFANLTGIEDGLLRPGEQPRQLISEDAFDQALQELMAEDPELARAVKNGELTEEKATQVAQRMYENEMKKQG